uniref:Uncharacterized protein n=1 Tax=Rhizophora mucronata TaxID=61149 RepID=A0A2P2Q3W1_RHIMU
MAKRNQSQYSKWDHMLRLQVMMKVTKVLGILHLLLAPLDMTGFWCNT